MKIKIAVLVFIMVVFNVIFLFKYSNFDAISGATSSSSSSGGSADKTQAEQKKHKSYALKVILNAEQKQKNEKLAVQIDNCFKAREEIEKVIKSKELALDVMSLYLIVEENDALLGQLTAKELGQASGQIQKIKEVLPAINAFLEQYDSGEVAAGGMRKILRDMEILTDQYRAMQWILYI